jgi:hypothetical protein
MEMGAKIRPFCTVLGARLQNPNKISAGSDAHATASMQMIVLFAGEGLELLAHKLPRHIPACVHRVAEAVGQPRSVFIFEQKYASLMRAGKEGLRYAFARWMACRDVCCPVCRCA